MYTYARFEQTYLLIANPFETSQTLQIILSSS